MPVSAGSWSPDPRSAPEAFVSGTPEHQSRSLEQLVGPVCGRPSPATSVRQHLLVHGDEPSPAVLAVDTLPQQIHPNLQGAAADRTMLVEVDVGKHHC